MTKWKETEIGRIPEEWGRIRIGDLFFVKNGKTNTQDAVTNGNYPLFDRSTQIKSSNKYLFDSEAIIIPGEGKEFVPRYFSGKFDLHQRAYAITPKTKNICVKFFYYWMYYYRTYLERIAVGSTVRSLRLDHLVSFPAPNPTLEEQQAISKILSDLDSKIELNNQMNATLEAMAQAIFKHWFIDFEFPDENCKPYKSSGGKMVDSELGEIPEGWKLGALRDLADVNSGKRPYNKSNIYTEEFSVELLGASSVMGYVKEALYTEPIIVIGRVGTHGIVQRINTPSWPSDNTLVIRSRYYEYVFQCLKRIDYNSLNIGSTQPLITQTQIKNHEILIPEKRILAAFESLLSRLYNEVEFNSNEITNLSSIRDSLLPKLMSGQIRVPVEVIKNA